MPTIPTDLDDLGDVSITSAASGDALTFDGNDWVNTALGLDDLSDVSLSTPASGDALIYDGADWENTALATVATSGNYSDLTGKPTFTDITSLVTWGESKGGGTRFYYKDGAIYLLYQGEAKAHAANDLLFTLPSGYRPSANQTIFPFIKNANAYGNASITGADGKCVVNVISSTTVSGRIYFNTVIVL